MPKSQFLKDKDLNLYRGVAIAPPATFYFALLDASGTEPTGGGYARVAVAAATASFAAPADAGTDRRITNAFAITFPAPTADWFGGAPATRWRSYDAATGGNYWHEGVLEQPRTILSGDPPPTFPAGALYIDE